MIQVQGLAHIEETIAAKLKAMHDGRSVDQDELFTVELPLPTEVQRSIALYESAHGIELTPEQREAVLTCAANRVSLILGGAGTGKTTVLKALCHAIDQVTPGTAIHQLALAGRAAQRMTQATGRQSKTIAAFLLDEAILSDIILEGQEAHNTIADQLLKDDRVLASMQGMLASMVFKAFEQGRTAASASRAKAAHT